MSSTIKQAIEALKARIAAAYSAISNKGGTLPTTQDSENLAIAIASIPQTSPSEDEIIDNNDIFFIDHFGIQGAYNKEDVAQWTSIQFTPREYEYLSFHSFTHSLEEIQDGRMHCIGVLYDVLKPVIDITVKEGDIVTLYMNVGKDPNIPGFTWYPSITINWGDESVAYTNAGSSKAYTHKYSIGGTFSVTADFNQDAWWVNEISARDEYIKRNVNFVYTKLTYGTETASYAKYLCLPYNFSTYGSNFCNSAPHLKYLVMPPIATSIGLNFGINAVNLRIVVFSKVTNASSGSYLSNVNTLKLIDFPDDFPTAFVRTNTRKVKLPKNRTITSLTTSGIDLQELVLPSTMGIRTLIARNYLDELIVPEGVTSYTQTWVYGAITNLYLPSTLTNIDYTRGRYIHIKATTPPVMAASGRVNNVTKIYVPYSADHSVLDAYKTATNWSALASYMEEEIE